MENPKNNWTKGKYEWKFEKGKIKPREGDWCSHRKGLIASLSTLGESVWRLDSWGCVCRPWRAPNSSVKPNHNKCTATGKYNGLLCSVVLFFYSNWEKISEWILHRRNFGWLFGTRHDLCVFLAWHSVIGLDGTDVYILFCWLRNPKSFKIN